MVAGTSKPVPGGAKLSSEVRLSAAGARARAALSPFDLALRHHRAYTAARRLTLALSLLATFGLPLWHLQGSASPRLVGPPGAIGLFGLELIDPLPLAALAVAQGASWPLFWLALPALALVLVLGRFFCGWVCPYVPLLAASNAARGLLSRLGVPLYDLRLPRSVAGAALAAVLALTALLGAQVAPLVYPPSLISRAAFHALFYGGLGAGAALVFGAFAFDTFVSRAGFCRSVCPGGALYALLGTFSPVTVKLAPGRCTGCTACDVVCNLGQSPMTGRIDSGCERCGKCVAVCPTDALRIGVGRRP